MFSSYIQNIKSYKDFIKQFVGANGALNNQYTALHLHLVL